MTAAIGTAGAPWRDRLFVSPAEAARISSLGRSTLYLALRSGDLPSVKCGRRRLIRVEDLEDFLANRGGQA